MFKQCIVVLFALAACGCQDTEETLVDSELVQVYTDILLIRAEHSDTAIANPMVDSTLAAHSYTYESYEKEWKALYAKHGPTLIHFLDSVKVSLQSSQLEQDTTNGISNP